MPLYQPTTPGVSDHGALTGLSDDDHTAYATNAEFDNHDARHANGGADEMSIAGLDGTPVELTNHLADATDAHDASAISIVDVGTLITATEVEGALQELAAASASAHIADATDAHDASAISVLDVATNFTATEVESALAELFAAISAGGIPGTIVDAKGDLIVATGADTVVRFPAGTNGYFLTADSGETTGLKYVAGGGATFIAALVTNSAAQTRNDAALQFNTEVSDPAGFFAGGAPSRFTVPSGQDGLFRVSGGGYAETGDYRYAIYKNGAIIRSGSKQTTWYNEINCVLPLVATDYVELFGLAGAGRDYGHASLVDAQSWFSIQRIGA